MISINHELERAFLSQGRSCSQFFFKQIDFHFIFFFLIRVESVIEIKMYYFLKMNLAKRAADITIKITSQFYKH